MSLNTFTLDDLAQYTPEGAFPADDSADFRVFYVGRDDVHSILLTLFEAVTLSAKMNMFGYDDDELNTQLWKLAENPSVVVQVTLDKSQSGGVHEKKILAADIAADATKYAASFVVGQSSTHQISHTKGGIQLKGAQQAGWKAQNNTLAVYTNPVEIAKFSARLDYEHGVAVQQSA